MIKILVVDDQSLYRKIISDILAGFADVEVVGTASNGKIALSKIEQLRPDLLTLDVEMPGMNGLELLRKIRQDNAEVSAIMVSAVTEEGARNTVKALELGAFDFITKPSGPDMRKNLEALRFQLKNKISSFIAREKLRATLSRKPANTGTVARAVTPARPAGKAAPSAKVSKIKLVAIGISTGGPDTLSHLVPEFSAGLNVPVAIVLHMPPVFTHAFATSLDKKSAVRVVEAAHGQVLQAGTVYLAPGGKQMKLKQTGSLEHVEIVITNDPPENYCQPSADYLFRSVAELYGKNALGIIMTGMGNDGAKGLAAMKQAGAKIIAQDEQSCVVYGMPAEAVKAGVVDEILPLDAIGDRISWLASLR